MLEVKSAAIDDVNRSTLVLRGMFIWPLFTVQRHYRNQKDKLNF